GVGGDLVAPADITDLSTTSTTGTSISLQWTAPGDDDNTGTADQYDIRYSESPINNDTDFNNASQVLSEPAPQVAGSTQTDTASGLDSDTRYYFAIRTADEVPNWSGLSNSPYGDTDDITPPADVTDLSVIGTTGDSISLQWTLPGDDGSTGTASIYNLRYSESSINNDTDFDNATDLGGTFITHAAGYIQTQTVTNSVMSVIHSDTRYYFAVKTKDEANNWSGLSNSPYGDTTDITAPATISDLNVISETDTTVTLGWTAVGDDGTSGTASEYDIRYSESPISGTIAWDSAIQVSGEPYPPQPAGNSESFIVTSLNSDTLYYFAMKAADEVPNWSGISNVDSTYTDDVTPPADITDLITTDTTGDSITLEWTAVGDDDNIGTADQYDIRYSKSPINAGNWNSATQVSGEPTPQIAGSSESHIVIELDSDTRYYFAIKTADEVPNWSGLSNFPYGDTDDVTPPASISDLSITSETDTTITLEWSAPGDDGNFGTAAEYDIRYSESPINT
ncbi:MAG: fibronectin type III domain-containing protein, partial [Synergistota bacterium]|nr:fibronectin type III domain-containing protein [Synergistota bacterium]